MTLPYCLGPEFSIFDTKAKSMKPDYTETSNAVALDALVPMAVEPLGEAYELGYQAGYAQAKKDIQERLEKIWQK